MPLRSQSLDDRAGRTVMQFLHEQCGFFGDNLVGFLNFATATFTIQITRGFQVIDIIEEDVVVNIPD